ncbi:MAG: hypothetical protein CMIDDMOC_00636 [Sodalis sp. Fle]|nr:MAG: hypothetical protein CMIDDMOC_00636 [Sodalis sp. Fle]
MFSARLAPKQIKADNLYIIFINLNMLLYARYGLYFTEYSYFYSPLDTSTKYQLLLRIDQTISSN